MPIEKSDSTFLQRFIVPLVLIFLVLAFLAFIAMRFFWEQHTGWVRWIPFCVVLLLMLAAIFTLHHRVLHRYRCPHCGASLSRFRAEPERAEEYRYHCAACDVIWTTGLREGGDA